MKQLQEYIAFDLEFNTVGEHSHIIQVSAVKYSNHQEIALFDTYVHTKVPLQSFMIIMVYITLIIAAVSLNQRWLMWIAVTVFLIAMNGMVWYFKQQVVYLCPNCHQTFTPTYQAFNLAKHTPKTRKVFCPHCHQKSHCIELAREER